MRCGVHEIHMDSLITELSASHEGKYVSIFAHCRSKQCTSFTIYILIRLELGTSKRTFFCKHGHVREGLEMKKKVCLTRFAISRRANIVTISGPVQNIYFSLYSCLDGRWNNRMKIGNCVFLL